MARPEEIEAILMSFNSSSFRRRIRRVDDHGGQPTAENIFIGCCCRCCCGDRVKFHSANVRLDKRSCHQLRSSTRALRPQCLYDCRAFCLAARPISIVRSAPPPTACRINNRLICRANQPPVSRVTAISGK